MKKCEKCNKYFTKENFYLNGHEFYHIEHIESKELYRDTGNPNYVSTIWEKCWGKIVEE